jgi:sulfur transfer protein SufE
MNKYPEKLQSVINELSSIPEEYDRMALLIDYAEKFGDVPKEITQKPFPPEVKVPFCESGVSVFTRMQDDGTLKFYFYIDNPQGISAQALASIFQETLNGLEPEEIIKIPHDIVYDIFGSSLSMGKNMGLTGILLLMQRDAKKYIEKKAEVKN